MYDLNVEFPYPIGTYFSKTEGSITHVDQLYEYIIDRNGISVVVVLDAFTDPRLSTRIGLDSFVANWTELNISNDMVCAKQKVR